MSAAGRTPGLRSKDDAYETAPWAVYRLLEAVASAAVAAPLPHRRGDMPSYWLEPCAGTGNIIRAVNSWYAHDWSDDQANIRWHACEIRPECEESLKAVANPVIIGDFLRVVPAKYDVIITNPPYSLAEEFLRACLPIADHVIMLLRLNWLEGRNEIWSTNPADVWVLPNRIPFGRNKHGKVGTDATAYAWMHWHKGATGRLRMLARTSKAVRSEYRKYLDMTLPKLEEIDERSDREPASADEPVRAEAHAARPGVTTDASAASGGEAAATGQLDASAADRVCGGGTGEASSPADAGRDEADRGGRADAGPVQAASAEPAPADPAGPDSFGGEDFPCERCVQTPCACPLVLGVQ